MLCIIFIWDKRVEPLAQEILHLQEIPIFASWHMLTPLPNPHWLTQSSPHMLLVPKLAHGYLHSWSKHNIWHVKVEELSCEFCSHTQAKEGHGLRYMMYFLLVSSSIHPP